MTQLQPNTSPQLEGAAFTWMLEHIMAHPGTYELPLRTMYMLNSATTQQPSNSSAIVGNAFPTVNGQIQKSMTTATAAAQLRANLMSHVAQQPSQPQSLPPSFISSVVRRCFFTDLTQVDFPQALTALDYLRDLETRRRNEIVATLMHLGIEKSDVNNREKLAKDYPHAYSWIEGMEEKERKVEMLYTHVYLGLRRWTLVNEMSLTPFNKQNCIAMLNTVHPPPAPQTDGVPFLPPTKQLTRQILLEQHRQFFRYIQAVENKGTQVLKNVMAQGARPGEENGWSKVRDDLDSYLRMANSIIDECLEMTGRSSSPRSATFPVGTTDEEPKRKVDSGISFGSGYTSHRSSGHSHATRPSTSSSLSNHSRHTSRDKPVDKSLPAAPEEDETSTLRPAGSALERIARELRKIGSRSNMRDESKPRQSFNTDETAPVEADSPPSTPARGLRWKRSLRTMRSSSRMRSGSTSRPGSRNGSIGHDDVPTFDREAMRRQREAWEASNPIHRTERGASSSHTYYLHHS